MSECPCQACAAADRLVQWLSDCRDAGITEAEMLEMLLGAVIFLRERLDLANRPAASKSVN